MSLEPKSFEAAITAADFSSEDYCGTRYAAKLMGLSAPALQAALEKGEIEAWKTLGGHHRIALKSIHAWLGKNNPKRARAQAAQPGQRLRVLLVEDDESARELYNCLFDEWDLPMDCTWMSSALEAMMDIASMRPDVLITDLSMPGVDGIEMLRTLQRNHHLAAMQIVVISGLPAQAIAGRGGLPPQARLIHKPLNADWLHGYLSAQVDSQRQKAAAGPLRP
jgi:excisionase family DNA binding protein